MPLLLLVDGSSYLYRAFHALPDLRNKAGEPTGAIYGVLNMLRRLESDYKAEFKAVVFDAKGKTFRDDWYPEYKAHRPPMPDDLVQQIEPLHAAIKAAGWPLLMVDGVEADDVIGTLATNATAAGIETLISTGDKDLTQLVDSHVRWYNTMSNELLDAAGVEAKFGVPPNKIVDYLALVGDTVDGVPGVAKCGPKTALKWLAQYGSLDEVVAHADEIGGVVGQNLRDHLAFLPLGKKLVTVACDLSNLPAPDTLTTSPRDNDALRELYTRYQFRTWLGEIDGPEAAAAVPARTVTAEPASAAPVGKIDVHYETVVSWPQFDAWLAKIEAAELTALDTETTSLDSFAARIVGISLSVKVGEACYIPLGHTAPGVADQLPLDEVLARLSPGWNRPNARRYCRTQNTTSTSSPTTASRWPASPTTPCCRATSSSPTRATTSASSARATSDWRPSLTKTSAARAPSRSASIRSISSAPPPTPPRTPTSPCACMKSCIHNSPTSPACRASITRLKCRPAR